MKKKINIQMMYIVLLAILATLFALIGVFYNLFQQEVFDDLRAYTVVLQEADLENIVKNDRDNCNIKYIKQRNRTYLIEYVQPHIFKNTHCPSLHNYIL